MGVATLPSCVDAPTEVVVDVMYEGVHCGNTAAVAVGSVGELGDRPASATSTKCDEQTGSLGRVVVTPKGDEGAEFAVEVRVRPDQGDPSNCLASNDYDGCIVARRVVSYIPGRSVTMRIDLRDPCVNTPCDQETTCIAQGFDKSCATAKLDLSKCDGGCDEETVLAQSKDGDFTCPEGYEHDADDAAKCVDVDECDRNEANCDAHANCENTEGSFTCSCYTGYEGDGVSCEQSACLEACDANATCKPVSGEFECVCDDGYFGDGTSCADIDECKTGLDDCPGTSTCENTKGSFECTCPAGYELTASGCKDIDECAAKPCKNGGTCTQGIDSYSCACPVGYHGTNCEKACPAGYTGESCETKVDVCAEANEGGVATLKCAPGEGIQAITFASYGTPTGTCRSYAKSGCDASSTENMVRSLCLGKNTCSVDVNDTTFGDPCGGTDHLAMQASCGAPICGNLITEAGETCDDGNTMVGDGCSDVCVIEPDPCVSYGGTHVFIGPHIRVCQAQVTWGSWDNALITAGFTVCTKDQWAAYAPAAMFTSYGMNTTDDPALWIDNASCGAGFHREVHSSIMMNDASCYDGASCCWQDESLLRFAVCGP